MEIKDLSNALQEIWQEIHHSYFKDQKEIIEDDLIPKVQDAHLNSMPRQKRKKNHWSWKTTN
jgi:hypothetical protein